MPSICELIRILKELNTDENSVNEIATSIYNLGNYIGETLGPFLGGFITANYSFSSSCGFISFLNFIFSCAYFLFNSNQIQIDIRKYLQNTRYRLNNKLNINKIKEKYKGWRKLSIELNNLPIKRVKFYTTRSLIQISDKLNTNLLENS